jgi:hypothetical protein
VVSGHVADIGVSILPYSRQSSKRIFLYPTHLQRDGCGDGRAVIQPIPFPGAERVLKVKFLRDPAVRFQDCRLHPVKEVRIFLSYGVSQAHDVCLLRFSAFFERVGSVLIIMTITSMGDVSAFPHLDPRGKGGAGVHDTAMACSSTSEERKPHRWPACP